MIVATDDARVADACRGFGAEVAMTRSDHATGTDRLAEVARGLDAEIIVNIQGDEPLIEGFVIDAAVEALRGRRLRPDVDGRAPGRAGGTRRPEPREGRARPRRLRALLLAQPHPGAARSGGRRRYWQHVGLYAYRRPFLLDFVKLERTPLERAEALEQLRALEHGHRIRCGKVEGWLGIPVDVPADVARVEARLRELGRC